MSFDVFLISSSASPSGAEADMALDRALALCGARRGATADADIVLPSGDDVEFFGAGPGEVGGMFALRSLDQELANLIFEVADATRCLVIFPGDEPAFLRTPGHEGVALDPDAPEIVEVEDAAALFRRLHGPAESWADYAGSVTGAPPPDAPEATNSDPTLLDRFFKRSNKKD
ncbi:MAG: hypothetical protein JF588_15970 [Caulobacterales bacterium]|nr:hypothetical protein [Caulobacterales bacterium]